MELASKPISRRKALAAGVATAAMIVPRHVLGGPGYQAPSDTLRIAGVGVGGMGRRYLEGCSSERIVALCDVDHSFAAPVFRKYSGARVYSDFRKMFDQESKNVDAVIVATPDHNHAIITARALREGKHVYCAKPLTHNIHESRVITKLAAEAKVATQMSVQSCASEEACAVTEALMSGVIGPVREVHVWTDHPVYPAGLRRPSDEPAVPYGLDWDLWIGPAPFRAYHPAYHPWIWRSWWDFGSGTVGDMACHALHVFFNALKLETPSRVYASRSTMRGGYFKMFADGREEMPPLIPTPETESFSSLVSWEYPERGGLPPLALHWYDGGMRPHRPMEMSPTMPMPSSGLLFVGDKGKMLTGYSGGRIRLLPEQKFRDFAPPAKTLVRSKGHYKEWVEACKGGNAAHCNFAFGGKMNEVAQLGVLAARAARLLEWDAPNMRITNDEEANAWLNPPYRKGWVL